MSTELPVASPCIKQCRLDASGRLCLGCRRTTTEIAGWSGFDERQKRAVLQRLAKSLPIRTECCPKCGNAFECGSGGQNGGCWCMDWPATLPVNDAATACLCPVCLAQAIAGC